MGRYTGTAGWRLAVGVLGLAICQRAFVSEGSRWNAFSWLGEVAAAKNGAVAHAAAQLARLHEYIDI